LLVARRLLLRLCISSRRHLALIVVILPWIADCSRWNIGNANIVCVPSLTTINEPIATLTTINEPIATLTTIVSVATLTTIVSVAALTGVHILGISRVLLVRRATDIVALWRQLRVIVALWRQLRVIVALWEWPRVIVALWRGRLRVHHVHLPTCWLRVVAVTVLAGVVGEVGYSWVIVRGSIHIRMSVGSRVGTRVRRKRSCWYTRWHIPTVPLLVVPVLTHNTTSTSTLHSLLYSVSHRLDSSLVVALQVTFGLL
jgi:hypothetical protein